MALKVIPLGGAKDKASLQVFLIDPTTKKPVDCEVEVWAHRKAELTKKGTIRHDHLWLSSGSKEAGDFFDGWIVKLYANGKILKWPIPESDKVPTPKGGMLHKLTIEVEAPRAKFAVDCVDIDGTTQLEGVEIDVGGGQGKTDKFGGVVVSAPIGKTTLTARKAGYVVRNQGGTAAFETTYKEELEVPADGKGTKQLILEKASLKGIKVRHPGTKGVKDPSQRHTTTEGAKDEEKLRRRDSAEKDLGKNAPVVFVRGCGKVLLEAMGNAEDLKVKWDVEPHAGGARPALVVKDGGHAAELSADLGGAFAVSAAWPPDAPTRTVFMNIVFVSVTVDPVATPVFAGTFKDATSEEDKKNELIGAGSGEFNSTRAQSAFSISAAVSLAGGGDGGLGVERVNLHILQNLHDSSVRGHYEDGGTSLEIPKKHPKTGKRYPALDATGLRPFGAHAKPPADAKAWPSTWPGPLVDAPSQFASFDPPVTKESPLYWLHVTVTPDQKARNRTVVMWDSPQTGWPVAHVKTKKDLETTSGANMFTTCIAAISDDARNSIVVVAKFTWFVRFDGEASLFGTDSWRPKGAKTLTNDTAWTPFSPATGGQDAGEAGIDSFPPRANRGMDLEWS